MPHPPYGPPTAVDLKECPIMEALREDERRNGVFLFWFFVVIETPIVILLLACLYRLVEELACIAGGWAA